MGKEYGQIVCNYQKINIKNVKNEFIKSISKCIISFFLYIFDVYFLKLGELIWWDSQSFCTISERYPLLDFTADYLPPF